MCGIDCLWEEPAVLGEGPLWAAEESALYWLDILGSRVHRLGIRDGARRTWKVKEPITSLAVRRQGGLIGTAFDGFCTVDLTVDEEVGRWLELHPPERHRPGNRFNDGKVDAQGRYWAGSMDQAEREDSGSLYRLDPDLSLHRMDEGYVISNGPAFSPDGSVLYHTDSVRRVVYAFDLRADGGISDKRVFVALQGDDEGQPDGMTVDAEGCIWLCHFGGARLTRYSPRGELLEIVPMPVPNVTSCTFGGPRLDTLYITTARVNLDEAQLRRYPLSGSLFSCRPGVAGLPTHQFAG